MIEETKIDSTRFRHVLGHYPTGVCVVTASTPDGAPAGMAVGSFTSVSLDPPLVAFFPGKRSTTWPKLQAVGKFCVNVLSADQQDVCRQFAISAADKFAGISHSISTNGSPILDGAVAWIECALHAVHEAGDHYVALGRVLRLEVVRPERPLVFFRGNYGEFKLYRKDEGRMY